LIRTTASFQATHRTQGHVLVTPYLTGKTNPREITLYQPLLLSLRHLLGFPRDELDTTSRTPCTATARVQHIHARILFHGYDQPSAVCNINGGISLNC
jgi:hypothetical protein